MNTVEVIDVLYRLKTGVIGIGAARHERPHKPLMLLAVFDAIAAGEAQPDRIEWSQWLRDRFRVYFELVASRDDSCTPELPFYHMKGDGFWRPFTKEVKEIIPLHAPPRVRDCDTGLVWASFREDWHILLAHPLTRMEFRDAICSRYFPHAREQIAAKFLEPGFNLDPKDHSIEENDQTVLPGRSSAFRRRVIELYDYQCAACGLRIWIKKEEINFVDAAHLIPFSESRNDHPTNGVALCKNHHWALDQHLIAPDEDRIWRISRLVDHRRSHGEKELSGLSGKPLLSPKDEAYLPNPEALSWRLKRLLN